MPVLNRRSRLERRGRDAGPSRPTVPGGSDPSGTPVSSESFTPAGPAARPPARLATARSPRHPTPRCANPDESAPASGRAPPSGAASSDVRKDAWRAPARADSDVVWQT
ncbi:MAG: hypothetical protein MZU84_02550 [Sphingobacterium sp.]|nr:hypothetical protein [Sphingobacterium sp.]